MRSILLILTACAMILTAPMGQARDTKHMYSILGAMETEDFKERLDPEIGLYFSGQDHPAPGKEMGQYVSNRKTNAFGKSDQKACYWAFLSALITLQERAKTEGGNAVIDIHSYYKKDVMRSAEEFECHAGTIMAGVALRGTVVHID